MVISNDDSATGGGPQPPGMLTPTPSRTFDVRRVDPAWRGRLWWIVFGYLAALGFGSAYAIVLQRSGEWATGFPWEVALMHQLHIDASRAVDTALLVLPWFGTNITLIPLVLAAAIVLWRKKRRELAMHLLVVQVGSYTLNPLLKMMFDRPRPELWERRGQFAWAAYPSGHAIASVAILFTVAILLRRDRGWRWPLPVAAVLTAITLYSRIYLGVHWPTDVISGAIMGAIWLIATILAFRPPVGTRRGDFAPANGASR